MKYSQLKNLFIPALIAVLGFYADTFAQVDADTTLPLFNITRNWFTKESGHFIFHSENKDDLPDSALVKKLDDFFLNISSLFQKNNRSKINYYKCSYQLNGRFYNKAPAFGYATPRLNIVSSVVWDNYHEITHILTSSIFNCPIPLLEEGIAVYYGGTSYFGSNFITDWSRDLALLNKAPRIFEIYLEQEFWNSKQNDINNNYFFSGAFSKYLIENYGVSKFIQLNKIETDTLLPKQVKSVYGKDIFTLENDFTNWLIENEPLQISTRFSNNAEEIFSSSDALFDDNGDGSYVYPNDPDCKKGILDLTLFRVLQDGANYYFELKFRNLVDNDSVEWGFYRTYAEVCIKLNKNNSDRTHSLSGNIDLAGIFDYVLTISDKGIKLDNYSDTQLLSMKLFRTNSGKFGDTLSKSIKFSVSKKLIPGVNKSSGFFVGIGASDITDGFKKYSGSFVGQPIKISGKPGKNNGGCNSISSSNPVFYDILLPAGVKQSKLLTGATANQDEKIMLPYIYGKK